MVAAPPGVITCITRRRGTFNTYFTDCKYLLAQAFQLVDHALGNAEPALPEGWIARVGPKGASISMMRCRAATWQALGEALGGVLVDRVERVYQATPKAWGIDRRANG
jgi:hypothetical protein